MLEKPPQHQNLKQNKNVLLNTTRHLISTDVDIILYIHT